MGVLNRRSLVQLAGAACVANVLHSADAEDRQNAALPATHVPRLGVVTKVLSDGSADATIKWVHDLGFSNCQIFFEHLTLDDVKPLLAALSKYGVEVSAVSEHNPGPRVFNFYEGPLTVGIVPPANPNHRALYRVNSKEADLCVDFLRS
jgi:L-ribulose-5-phosphate 3-epimerase